MTTAIDIALLPPADVSARAIALSAALPATESPGLVLGDDCLPHITLTQQFVPTGSLDALIIAVDDVLRDLAPLHLRVTGASRGSSSVWMAIEQTPALMALHERLMHVTEPFEVDEGDAAAFVDGDPRDRDIDWVRHFRRKSSFDRFTPHITLGHAASPPVIESVEFAATTVALCHLGRFCTCRRIIREW